MTYINPLAGALLTGSVAQQQAATDKTRQVRRAQAVARNVAAQSDTLDHEVENAEAVAPVRDDGSGRRQPGDGQHRDGSGPPDEGEDGGGGRLDVRA